MFKKLTNKIIAGDFPSPSIPQWIAGFAVIVMIRALLETFSSPVYSGIIPHNIHLVHFSLFFLATVFLAALVVAFFTKQASNKILNLALYGLPIIFLAPIIDLLVTKGQGIYIKYIYGVHSTLFFDFITFMGTSDGATTGIRIEIFTILLAIGWYVWEKRKNLFATMGAMFSFYFLGFIFGSLPGFIYTISHAPLEGITSSVSFINNSILESNIPTNILHGELLYSTTPTLFALGRSSLMAQFFFIFTFILGVIWFWYSNTSTAKIIFKNVRTTRILFGFSLLALGILIAQNTFSVVFTWVDWISIVVLYLSWFSACMYATHVNDVADIAIDEVSNPERPLPRGAISVGEMKDIGLIWLILSLVGAYIVGYFTFFMSIVFTSAYYVYSAHPFRLKRVPIFSSFLIAIAVLVTFLAGFFFASPSKMITEFPILYSLGIITLFTLGVNIRDIKDIEGDRKAGIQTLPVIFGRYGKHVVGVLLALSFLLAPFFLPALTTYVVAIPAAVLGYWFCVKEPYNESYIFFLFFAFCIASVFLK